MATKHPLIIIDKSNTLNKYDYDLREDDLLNSHETWTLGSALSKYASYYTSSLLLNVLLIAFYVV